MIVRGLKEDLYELVNKENYDSELLEKVQNKINKLGIRLTILLYLTVIIMMIAGTFLASPIGSIKVRVSDGELIYPPLSNLYIISFIVYVIFSLLIIIYIGNKLMFSPIEERYRFIQNYNKYNSLYKINRGDYELGYSLMEDDKILNGFFKWLNKDSLKYFQLETSFFEYIDDKYDNVEEDDDLWLAKRFKNKLIESGKLKNYKQYENSCIKLDEKYKDWLDFKHQEDVKLSIEKDISLVKGINKILESEK